MKKVKSGGGWPAVFYSFKKARESGGFWKFWKALRSKNACKTCAVGMGGQKGGMVNERGTFPEICKKGMQAMAADMQGAIPPNYFTSYSIPQMRAFSSRELEAAGRLTQPMIATRGDDYYRPISWEGVYTKIADKLKSLTPEETFWYFSGRSSNEAGFLLQLFARMYGTNNVNNCSFYCHQASGVGLTNVFGSGTASVVLEDVEHADLVFIIGGNPASNHPRMMSTLKHIRRKGGEVIVINPVVETGLVNFRVPSDPWSLLFGTKIASMYVQPHIGGDLALLYGISKSILEKGAHDIPFLKANTEGWDTLKANLESLSWEDLTERAGVDKKTIEEIAEKYAKAKNVVFSWTMGITHHEHGVQNVEAISNLALMRGMVGRKNAGMLPLRGHSNVQGIGSVGVTPKLKDAIFNNLQEKYGVKLPTSEGLDTMGCMEKSMSGELKFGFCLGGNLYGSNPDSQYAEESLAKLDMLVTMSTTLNTGHAYSLAEESIIIPVLARDEEPQPSTQESMFNYIRLSDGGKPRYEGPRAEVEVISEIAKQTLAEQDGPIDWELMESTSNIREAIGNVVPGFEKIRSIDRTKEEFQIGGRTFHEPKFATASGKANIQSHSIPELSERGQLRLMTVRSEGQFNTVVYEDYDLYRGVDARDVILMHSDDIHSLGYKENQRITVKSQTGQMDNIRIHRFDEIRPGNALMYYPEANVLVSRQLDPRSKTPAYKAVDIDLQPDGQAIEQTPPVKEPVLN